VAYFNTLSINLPSKREKTKIYLVRSEPDANQTRYR